MKKDSEYIEIDLGRLFRALKKKLWVMIIAALCCGAVGFSYARFLVVPTYDASALMYVNNNAFSLGQTISLSNSDLTASQSLVSTYIVIMKTRTTLDEVIEQANLDYTYEELYQMISASTRSGTAVFSITARSTDPIEAAKIANTVAEVLPERINTILEGSSARVVDYAVVPRKKSAPNITSYAMIGLFVGLFISALLIVVLELMNDSIRNAEMLPDSETIPVLGEIPNLRGTDDSEGFTHSHSKKKNTGRRKES